MVQRRGCKQAVDARDRTANLREHPPPAVSHRQVYREHPAREPARKFVLQPNAQLLPALPVRQPLDTLANLTEGEDAYMERLTWYLLKPRDHRLAGVAPDGL